VCKSVTSLYSAIIEYHEVGTVTLMGGVLHLVQPGGDGTVGCSSAQPTQVNGKWHRL